MPRRRRAPRIVLVAVAVLGALATVGAVLLFRDLSAVRAELTAARDTLRSAADDPNFLRTDEGRAATQQRIDEAVVSVDAARNRALDSVALSIAANFPGVRTQRTGVLELIDDTAAASAAGRSLVAKLDAVADNTVVTDGVVPLDGLRRLEADFAATATSLAALARSPGGLWGPLGDARRDFDDTVRSTAGRLSDGAAALRAAMPFMGADGERTYLVAAQNNAEMRDQGMVLSYAVVRFSGGRLTLDRNGSIQDLALKTPAPTKIPDGTAAVFGSIAPTGLWHSVNATADFAWSARAMADMYRQATGQSVDGIIAVDVPALAKLLEVVGPITVRGIDEPVASGNAARILLHDLYEGLPPSVDTSPRRELLSDVTKGVVQAITTGPRDGVALGRQLGDAAAGGHLRLWSAKPSEEEVFVRTGLGGGPASIAPERTFHVAVQNRTATKLDYFVTTSVRQVVDLTEDGDAIVHTTIVVENTAPVDGEPSYQLGPDQFTTRPGEYRAWLLLWSPPGSQEPPGVVEESGLGLTQHVIELQPGERKEIAFPDAIIRDAVKDGRLRLRLVPQPRLEPASLEVRLNAPGWRVDGPAAWTGPWNRVVSLSWRVRR